MSHLFSYIHDHSHTVLIPLVVASCGFGVFHFRSTGNVDNDFRLVSLEMPVASDGQCIADGGVSGFWTNVFSGFGCDSFTTKNGKASISLQPRASSSANETHSALLTGKEFDENAQFSCNVTTLRQLRTNSEPNPWEVGWVIWNYTDNEHFYYFIAKPNGWELGKRDPSFTGGQRFLDTGTEPCFPIGKTYAITVDQSGNTIRVSVDGKQLTRFSDSENPYTAGKIGAYTEDSEVEFDSFAAAQN